MRSSLLLCSLASTLLLLAHGYVLRPFAIAGRSSLQLNSASESSADGNVLIGANASLSSKAAWGWEQLASSVFEDDDRPIILFDGKCNLCNGGVNFALDHDPKAYFRFVSLQSKVGKSLLIRSGRSPDDISSIVVCSKSGEAYANSEAVLMIATGLEEPLPMVGKIGKLIPTAIRDALFKYISENRYRFAGELLEEYDSCRLDWDGEFDTRFVTDPPK